MERFRKETLSIDFNSHSWQDAVTVSGELLLKCGAIEKDYIQAMITAVNELGPYMVIIPHLAIAHAAPGQHVLADEIVLTVFKEPIYFNSPNDPVYIIIGLCALNPHSHLEHFQAIAEIFDAEEAWRDFHACNSVEELYKLINNY